MSPIVVVRLQGLPTQNLAPQRPNLGCHDLKFLSRFLDAFWRHRFSRLSLELFLIHFLPLLHLNQATAGSNSHTSRVVLPCRSLVSWRKKRGFCFGFLKSLPTWGTTWILKQINVWNHPKLVKFKILGRKDFLLCHPFSKAKAAFSHKRRASLQSKSNISLNNWPYHSQPLSKLSHKAGFCKLVFSSSSWIQSQDRDHSVSFYGQKMVFASHLFRKSSNANSFVMAGGHSSRICLRYPICLQTFGTKDQKNAEENHEETWQKRSGKCSSATWFGICPECWDRCPASVGGHDRPSEELLWTPTSVIQGFKHGTWKTEMDHWCKQSRQKEWPLSKSHCNKFLKTSSKHPCNPTHNSFHLINWRICESSHSPPQSLAAAFELAHVGREPCGWSDVMFYSFDKYWRLKHKLHCIHTYVEIIWNYGDSTAQYGSDHDITHTRWWHIVHVSMWHIIYIYI